MQSIAKEESLIPQITRCLLLSILKGKLAYNFTSSSLVLIPCLLNILKTLVTENSANIDLETLSL